MIVASFSDAVRSVPMQHVPVLATVCLALVSSRPYAHAPVTPNIELRSGPLTPALVLDECRRPLYQIRLLVEGDGKRGTLILDSNAPEFDEFGELVGGILTTPSGAKHGALPATELECVIERVKSGREKWLLFRLAGAKITSPLLVATRGRILDAGPARLLVLGGDKRVKTVIEMTRYGLVVP
jgi:hypothetical protein